jgi:hypothetical protein
MQSPARARRQRSLTGQSSGGSARVGRPDRVVGRPGGGWSAMAARPQWPSFSFFSFFSFFSSLAGGLPAT